jgi:hypothetical protein
MAESLESRRFERKTMFDVPLPIRKSGRDMCVVENSAVETNAVETETPTMAFSLMTKRGNKQQVRLGIVQASVLLLMLSRPVPSRCHRTLVLQLP